VYCGHGRPSQPWPDLILAGPCSEKLWGPSLIYEYRPTKFTRHVQWQCCHHRHFINDSHNIIICTQNRMNGCGVCTTWLDTLWRQRATQNRVLTIISIISGMLLCCKNLLVLLWGPLFCGAPVRPNMLNMPKSGSDLNYCWALVL